MHLANLRWLGAIGLEFQGGKEGDGAEMTLAELISALEAASVGSDDLDRQIAAWRWSCPLPNAGIGRRYTRDINDALTLVPENCPVDLHIGPYKTSNDATVYTKRVWLDEKNRRCTTYDPHEAKCVRDGTLNWNTPALALCIAALRARAAGEK